jgi:hypothetical protein
VEILGNIFEQSISDLEQLHLEIAKGGEPEPAKAGPSRWKKEGAFYTPAFITRYIVSATSGRVARVFSHGIWVCPYLAVISAREPSFSCTIAFEETCL